MPELPIKSFEELERYLRQFTTWRGDGAAYDVGGAFHLWRALLVNLKEKGLDQEVADYAASLSEEEIRFLERVIFEAKRVEPHEEKA